MRRGCHAVLRVGSYSVLFLGVNFLVVNRVGSSGKRIWSFKLAIEACIAQRGVLRRGIAFRYDRAPSGVNPLDGAAGER